MRVRPHGGEGLPATYRINGRSDSHVVDNRAQLRGQGGDLRLNLGRAGGACAGGTWPAARLLDTALFEAGGFDTGTGPGAGMGRGDWWHWNSRQWMRARLGGATLLAGSAA